jgi:chaperonin cofactor prefoldin
MRGRRFRRPATKKPSSTEKREERETSAFYQEREPLDPLQVSSKASNALEHLGNQRFALPPFSEHFQRWMKDVRVILAEFETDLPAVDQAYHETVERTLTNAQDAFGKRIDAENNVSEETSTLQQELTACGVELSKLEHEYRARAHEVRRGYERSAEKLRGEMDSLDKDRSNLLRRGPTLFERIFRRPDTRLEESASALQSKKAALGNKKATLNRDLDNLRADYESNSKQLTVRREALRAKLAEVRGNTLDDALEIRRLACQELCRAMAEAVSRLLGQHAPPNAENIQ